MADYEPGPPYEVIFPAEETTASFNIFIIDDDEYENDEIFNLFINRSKCRDTDEELIPVTIVDNDYDCK